MSRYAGEAAKIRELATELAVEVRAHNGIVTVVVHFTPGNADAYIDAEERCNRVLRQFAMIRPGSVWGNDSGSIGSAIGMREGICLLNKSGVNKLLAKEFAS